MMLFFKDFSLNHCHLMKVTSVAFMTQNLLQYFWAGHVKYAVISMFQCCDVRTCLTSSTHVQESSRVQGKQKKVFFFY